MRIKLLIAIALTWAVGALWSGSSYAQQTAAPQGGLPQNLFTGGTPSRGDIGNVTVSRLAHGVPIGGELDYLDEGTLAAAVKARKVM